MDEQRFDSWVRSLANQRSRRRVMRGLLGGVAVLAAMRRGGSAVTARRGFSGPGDPCRHDDQCRAADTALVCAWNGFDYDGGLNCCAYEGGRCSDDPGCCGLNSCNGGFCGASGNFSASAGDGGYATASADGGTVYVGDVNSGGNVGNAIAVGDTVGDVRVSGGTVSNETSLSVSADGGVAIADASGGSGNVAGDGGIVYRNRSWAECSGTGCSCWQGPDDDNPCDWGLVCCLDANNRGTCMSLYACTGYGAPGDVCPRYCASNDECPSCVSGWCRWDGYCA